MAVSERGRIPASVVLTNVLGCALYAPQTLGGAFEELISVWHQLWFPCFQLAGELGP
jgi:hypothetical protein